MEDAPRRVARNDLINSLFLFLYYLLLDVVEFLILVICHHKFSYLSVYKKIINVEVLE